MNLRQEAQLVFPKRYSRPFPSCAGTATVRCSELELEGELDGAGAADLIERVEAAVGASGAQAARQGLRRLAERGTGQVVIGIRERTLALAYSLLFFPVFPLLYAQYS